MSEMAQLYHLTAAANSMMHYDLKAIDQLGQRDAWAPKPQAEKGSSASWTQSFDYLLTELARRCFDPDPRVAEDYVTMGPGRDDNRRWKSAHDTVHGEILPLIRSRLKLRQEGASREGVRVVFERGVRECHIFHVSVM